MRSFSVSRWNRLYNLDISRPWDSADNNWTENMRNRRVTRRPALCLYFLNALRRRLTLRQKRVIINDGKSTYRHTCMHACMRERRRRWGRWMMSIEERGGKKKSDHSSTPVKRSFWITRSTKQGVQTTCDRTAVKPIPVCRRRHTPWC